MTFINRNLTLACGVLAIGLPMSVAAAPEFSGEVLIEIQNDWAYDTDDKDAELNDLYTTIEPEFTLTFNDRVSINTGWVIEPIEDPNPGDSRAFTDHGLFIEALTVDYETEGLHLYAGKFGPHFSLAYDEAAGIYGTDMSEEYLEMSERIGAGFAVDLGGDGATYTVSGSLFTMDTSELSDSWGTKRGQTRERDGGVGNTGSLDSFAVALDVSELSWAPQLHGHLGFVRQKIDRAGGDTEGFAADAIDDETRIGAAVMWDAEVGNEASLTTLLEYAYFQDTFGIRDADADIYTVSTQLEKAAWNVALAYTRGKVDGIEAEYQFQASAGYAFASGLTLDVGWKYFSEGGEVNRVLGAIATYVWEL